MVSVRFYIEHLSNTYRTLIEHLSNTYRMTTEGDVNL